MELAEARADAQALVETINAVTQAQSPDEAARAALETVRRSFGWAYGSYWKVDPADQALHFVVESGDAGAEFRQVTRTSSFREGVGLAGRAWRQRDLYFTPDLGEMSDCVRAPAAVRAGVKSGVCFPIIIDGQVVGTMDFFATETLSLSEGRLSALRNVGLQVSQALERIARVAEQRASADAMLALLEQVAEHAAALGSASEELAATSTQMSSTAEETSSQAALVSSASGEISANIESVSSASEELSASITEIARNTAEAVRIGDAALDEARATNETVARLGRSSEEIGKVIKVITEIAQQTNLLALNATIEAARAGEAGKGFAVVASEVKELARGSAEASEDISQRIQVIQEDVAQAVAAISGISSTIGRVSEIQSSIASAVEEQSATTSEIARSVTEAARGVSEITANVESLAGASATTAHGAADTHAAAAELGRLAADLSGLVAKFRR